MQCVANVAIWCIVFPVLWVVLSFVAVCCSMLQCVAVCCSVLQCVAVCCSVLQCVAVCCSVVLSFVRLCWEVPYVAVCCSALQCLAVPFEVPSLLRFWRTEFSKVQRVAVS